MSDQESDEIPPESLFFKRRANLVPHVSAEEFRSVSEQLSKAEKSKAKPSEEEEALIPNKRAKKRNTTKKIASKAEETKTKENGENAVASPEVILPAAAKRRLKKLQRERALEAKFVELANQKVLSEAEPSPALNEVEEICNENTENACIILTVSYMSEISRLKCYQNEKFATIFPRVASLLKLKATELLLCLKEQNIKVDDTPKSLNITLNDVIECIPYKDDENSKIDDRDKLKLIFQSSDCKQKIDILVHKLEKMQDIMERYARLRALPVDILIFEFDGEVIEGTDTPEDLDMESGHCIDVKVQKNSSRRKKKNTYSKNIKEPEIISVRDSSESDSDVIML